MDAVVGHEGQQTGREQRLLQLRNQRARERFARDRVADEFEGPEDPNAANLADDRMLRGKLAQPRPKNIRPNRGRMLLPAARERRLGRSDEG